MTISDQDMERLAELAGKATPGPWKSLHRDTIGAPNSGLPNPKIIMQFWTFPSPADRAFIEAANPSTILSLIERLRDAEAMVYDAYQFAGNILDIAGLFEHPEGQRALDYFSRGKADPEWRWPKEDISCGKVGGDDDPR